MAQTVMDSMRQSEKLKNILQDGSRPIYSVDEKTHVVYL